MTNILVIRSSATGAASISNRLVDGYLAAHRDANPGAIVVERNLDQDQVPHIRAETLAGIGRPAPETEAAKPTRALSDALVAELRAADLIVFGAPMYNFGIATTLKSWFDHVLRAGVTFRYTEQGPEGLLKGKRALVVATSGGIYSDGPAAALDNHLPHLRALLGFMGITDVDVVRAEGLAFGPEAAEQAISGASAALADRAST